MHLEPCFWRVGGKSIECKRRFFAAFFNCLHKGSRQLFEHSVNWEKMWKFVMEVCSFAVEVCSFAVEVCSFATEVWGWEGFEMAIETLGVKFREGFRFWKSKVWISNFLEDVTLVRVHGEIQENTKNKIHDDRNFMGNNRHK
jgi:hypothetical protein